MRLTVETQDRLVNDTAMRLSGGSLVFFTDDQEEIARVHMPVPAFLPSREGRAISLDLPESQIAETGLVGWARLETPSGDVVAELTVGTAESDPPPDVLLQRLDFHKGGRLTVTAPILSMPSSS